jgi:hypothetical protein
MTVSSWKVLRVPGFLHIESRTVRYTLYVLFGIIVADGVLTQFLVTNGYGLEANPLLAPLVGGGSFLAIKVSAAFLATLFLWIKYNARPRLVYRIAVVALGVYTTIVYWNLFAFLLAASQSV